MKQILENIFIIIFGVVVGLALLLLKDNTKKHSLSTSAAPVQIAPYETRKTNIMDSPDGTETLTLEKNDNNGVISYSINDFFKKNVDSSYTLEIPFNSWSPDNQYFFLKNKTFSADDYLIFESKGKLFSNEQVYLSIKELFYKKVPNYQIEDVTGWAAPGLLLVNTKANETDKKVSFWFEVPSQSFIQLGTYFK